MQKCFINGVEVKVGQKWKDRTGCILEITRLTESIHYPIKSGNTDWCKDGKYYSDGDKSNFDLVEIVYDPPNPKQNETLKVLKELMKYFESGNNLPIEKAIIRSDSPEIINIKELITKLENSQE